MAQLLPPPPCGKNDNLNPLRPSIIPRGSESSFQHAGIPASADHAAPTTPTAMCLILLAFRAHQDADVILAGNRDEFYSRPSAPPATISRNPIIEAGMDLEAGGTWMGRNEHGLLAALTNRRESGGESPAAPSQALSRGEIVRGLLGRNSPGEAAGWLAEIDSPRYRPFNVLWGDRREFYFFSSTDREGPIRLNPGYYVLSNSTLDDRSWPKVERSHQFLQHRRGLGGEEFLLALQAFLCDSTPPGPLPGQGKPSRGSGTSREPHGPLGAVFVETPGYGTISASILSSGGTLGRRYYYAEAPAMRQARQGWAESVLAKAEPDDPPKVENPFRLVSF